MVYFLYSFDTFMQQQKFHTQLILFPIASERRKQHDSVDNKSRTLEFHGNFYWIWNNESILKKNHMNINS